MHTHLCLATKCEPPPSGPLHVKFLDGSPNVWDRVASVVAGPGGWNGVCGVKFLFEQNVDSPVRVTFEGNGTDYKDGLVRLGGMDDDTRQYILSRSVLHIFGHVLGLGHQWGGQVVRSPFSLRRASQAFGDEAEELLGDFCHNTFPSRRPALGEEAIMNYLCTPVICCNVVYLEGAAHRITPFDAKLVEALHGPPTHDWLTQPCPSLWDN